MKIHEAVRSYLALLLFAVAVLTFCGLLAPYKTHLDVLNDLRLHLLAVAFTILIISELVNAPNATFWSTLLLIINIALAVPSFYFVAPHAPLSSEGIRALTFNLGKGTLDPKRIVTMLREENADLVLLLGVNQNEMQFLDELGVLYPHQAVCSQTFLCQMALMSKKELHQVTFTHRDQNTPVTTSAYIHFKDRKIHLLGVELSHPFKEGNRQAEIDYLINRISSINEPLILLGTFNATPWSWTLSDLQMRAGLDRHYTIGANWPAARGPYPQFLIDHILTRGQFRTENVFTGQKTESNHFPVVVDLSLSQ